MGGHQEFWSTVSQCASQVSLSILAFVSMSTVYLSLHVFMHRFIHLFNLYVMFLPELGLNA